MLTKLLCFLAGVLCPFVAAIVVYYVYAFRGKNVGWPG